MLEIKENIHVMAISDIDQARVFLEKIRKNYLPFFLPVEKIAQHEVCIKFDRIFLVQNKKSLLGVYLAFNYEENRLPNLIFPPFILHVIINSEGQPDSFSYKTIETLVKPLAGIRSYDMGLKIGGEIIIRSTSQFNQLIGICKAIYNICENKQGSSRNKSKL